MTHQEKVDLAKKLLALAQFGIEGEKANAQKMLEDFLLKHNLDLDNLEDVRRTRYYLEINPKYQRLFSQIVFAYFDDRDIYISKDNSDELVLELTKLESVELKVKYEFFRDLFDKEYEIFYHAFIQKNKILPDTAGYHDWSKMTEQEKEEQRRILEMMKQITKGDLHKQLKQ